MQAGKGDDANAAIGLEEDGVGAEAPGAHRRRTRLQRLLHLQQAIDERQDLVDAPGAAEQGGQRGTDQQLAH
ncbi:MAG: hypothetical protein ACK56F_07190, partial [bacterium]